MQTARKSEKRKAVFKRKGYSIGENTVVKRLILTFFAGIFLLSSCTVLDRTPTIYYNESELSLADITNMRNDFPEETQKSVNLIPYSENSVKDIVYWVENGSVWHLRTSCGYIKDGSDLFYGSEEDALLCGKEKVCSNCVK